MELLTFGNERCSFEASAPFQFSWYDRTLDLARCAKHRIESSENSIVIHFSDFIFSARFPGNDYCLPYPEFTPDFSVSFELTLDDDELAINVSEVSGIPEGTARIAAAQNFFSFDSSGEYQAVLPTTYGMRYDFPRQDYFRRTLLPQSTLVLPMYAVFSPGGGIGLWCDDPDREVQFGINSEKLKCSFIRTELLYDDLANNGRRMTFHLFAPGEDFRTMANVIRNKMKRMGRFKSLEEKIRENPEEGHLPGTVFWKHNVYFRNPPENVNKTYSLYTARPDWNENEGLPGNWSADEIFDTAYRNGFDRVTVCNTGWNYRGFDAGYPTRLPVNPERGTGEDFRKCAENARKMSPGYTLSCHDNYIDAYPGDEYDPEEMYQPEPGIPFEGGVWRGGKAHWLDPRSAYKYARRDMPEIVKLTGRGCIYLDVMGGVPPVQSRAAGRPLTRREDLQWRRKIFEFTKKTFGALAVENCGTSEFADLADIGAYGWLHDIGILPQTSPLPLPLPLWQMVYHDSVLNFFGEGYAFVHGSEYRLYQALYCLLPANFDDHGKRLSTELRSAYTSRMTDFRELVPLKVSRDEDGAFVTDGVACSTFADGTEVTANFLAEPWSDEYGVIPRYPHHHPRE